MNILLVTIVAAIAAQMCSSATVEDAETKLKELREVTNREIEKAFGEYNTMSSEVDHVALTTKLHGIEEINKKVDKFQSKLASDKTRTYNCRGSRDHVFQHLQKLHSDELNSCVDEEGADSVNILNRQRMALFEYAWNAMYEEEKRIIFCGNDSKCLDVVIADIVDQIDQVGQVIKDEVEIAKHNKEVQLQNIKGCLSRHVADAEFALSSVPTCTY